MTFLYIFYAIFLDLKKKNELFPDAFQVKPATSIDSKMYFIQME